MYSSYKLWKTIFRTAIRQASFLIAIEFDFSQSTAIKHNNRVLEFSSVIILDLLANNQRCAYMYDF